MLKLSERALGVIDLSYIDRAFGQFVQNCRPLKRQFGFEARQPVRIERALLLAVTLLPQAAKIFGFRQ